MPFDPDELVQLLTPHCMDSDAQQAFVLSALGVNHVLIPDIHYDKSPATFILNMAQRVETYDPALLERLIAYTKAGGAKPKPRLFLSYARADDEPFVRRLYDDLREAGFDPWFDREKMPSRGLTFTTEIAHAIDGAERLILVVGPGAIQSEYVRAEWEHALVNCKPVIPILRLGELSLLPDELKQLHTPDFRAVRPYAEALTELRRILDDAPAPLGALKDVEPVPEWYIERPVDLKSMVDTVCSDGLTGAKPLVITSKQQTLSLTGIGGIGKTTLARALCHRCEVRYQFPDGIVWLEVGKSANAASLLGRAGELLGDQRSEYQNEPDAKARLAFWTSHKTALFILDDVWDHQIAEAFKGVGKTCRLVVTTRQPQIVNKLGAASQTVDRLTEDEGIRLIDKHLGRPSNALRPHDTVERAIVRLLEGHTLSIHIAAARLKERGAGFAPTLLSRLQNPDRLFKDLKMDESDKNHNLEVSLAESYIDLTSDGQRRFRALGVFAPEGTFDNGALKAVWADEDATDADDGIDLLTRAGLLVRLDEGRYRLHNLLRAYARALMEEKGETEAIAQRHFGHYFKLSGDQERNRDEKFCSHLQTEWANIRLGLFWGFTHKPRQAVDWACSLNYYMQLYKSLSERYTVLEEGKVAADQSGYILGQANMLQLKANLNVRRDQYELAREQYTDALVKYRAISDQVGEANILLSLGDLDFWETNHDSSREHYISALKIFEAIHHQLGQGNVLRALGDLERLETHNEAAEGYYKSALILFEMISDQLGRAQTIYSMGVLDHLQGNLESSYKRLMDVLDVFKNLQDRIGQANTLKALGDLERAKSNFAIAREHFNMALRIYEEIPDRLGQAQTKQSLGQLNLIEGHIAPALEDYNDALMVFAEIPDQRGKAQTLQALGKLNLKCGHHEVARNYLNEALSGFALMLDPLGEAQTHQTLAELEIEETHYGIARQHCNLALHLFKTSSDQLGQANTLNILGDLEQAESHYPQAREYFKAALHLAQQISNLPAQLNSLRRLAQLAWSLGQTEIACKHYESVFSLTDSHPAFANHPTTQALKLEYAEFCGDSVPSVGASAPNATPQQLLNAFMAVQSSDQMAQLIAQLPPEHLDMLEQAVEGVIAQYPPEQTEGVRQRLDDLRRLRGK